MLPFARQFVRRVVFLLEDARFPGIRGEGWRTGVRGAPPLWKTDSDRTAGSLVMKDVTVTRDKDPFYYASLLERQYQDILDEAPDSVLRAWRQRVWRYLAYCVDGGMLPGTLSISTMVSAHRVAGTSREASVRWGSGR